MNYSIQKKIIFSFLLLFCFVGCTRYERDFNEVIIHELSDNDMLNPINYQSAGSGYMIKKLYQTLLEIDFETLNLLPVLAADYPEVDMPMEGGLRITYTIRPEAHWDNGEPITAKDIEFTMKVIKNPKVDCARMKPYYEFIEDVEFYEDNPKKITFVCSEKYILAVSASGDYSILPKYIYDPKGLMNDFTIKQLNDNAVELAGNPQIIEFANEFNSEKYQREKGFVVGSGAYAFDEWVTGQKVVFVRKHNWWGDQIKGTNVYFEANPPKLIYQTINDQTTALVALKAEKVDVMRGIRSKDFIDLKKSEKFNQNFYGHTPMSLQYNYLGINTRLPKFSDVKTRQALAHIVDVDRIIETLEYGLSTKIIGPLHPSKTEDYNFNIKSYTYDIEKAKSLLVDAGWKDSNGNGILDKEINGELIEFNINYTFNSGNDIRKSVGLIFQEEARKVGINVSVVPEEWSIYLDNLKNHEFEMFYGAWISAPVPYDPKQIWHTESYNGGSNYVGFGNANSDAIIDSIRTTFDKKKRSEMYKKLQVILHEEVPYIFMHSPNEKIAIHKRFANAEASVMRPGYWEAGFIYADAKN